MTKEDAAVFEAAVGSPRAEELLMLELGDEVEAALFDENCEAETGA
jgi:hypothetical protein